jgi:hypothetical protein
MLTSECVCSLLSCYLALPYHDRRLVDTVCDALDISKYFDALLFSSAEGVEKPNAMIYERALKMVKHQGGKDQVLMIGDSFIKYTISFVLENIRW